MDFVVRPQSKIDPDEVRARAKQVVLDQRRMKVCFNNDSDCNLTERVKFSWVFATNTAQFF